jgi:hypothetical protein
MNLFSGLIFSFLLLISSAAIHAAPTCRSVYNIVGINLNVGSSPVQTFSRHKYSFKLIKIADVQENSAEYKMAMDYFNELYFKSLIVLEKDLSFIEKIKAANQLFLKQTHLLLMFDAKDPLKIIGGAAFVVVKNRDEFLPLQIELNLPATDTILENVFPKVEIARVSIDPHSVDFSQNFRKLIETIIEISSESSDIDSFYVYTSRFHKRRYSQFGFQGTLLADQMTLPQLEKNDIIAKVILPKK